MIFLDPIGFLCRCFDTHRRKSFCKSSIFPRQTQRFYSHFFRDFKCIHHIFGIPGGRNSNHQIFFFSISIDLLGKYQIRIRIIGKCRQETLLAAQRNCRQSSLYFFSQLHGNPFICHLPRKQKAFHQLPYDMFAVGCASPISADKYLSMILINSKQKFQRLRDRALAFLQFRIS